jgi:hypothetical protein
MYFYMSTVGIGVQHVASYTLYAYLCVKCRNMRENRGNAVVLPVLFAGYLRKKHPAKIPLPCVPGKNTRWRYICRVSQATVPSEEGLT